MDWIYFATDKQASLASTIGSIVNQQVLWRELLNSDGNKIANVQHLQIGDRVFVAWRATQCGYLKGSVARPLHPVETNIVIDLISGDGARELAAAGYPVKSGGDVEVIRLDEVEECFFTVSGSYGGHNAIHRLDPADLKALETAMPIPLDAVTEPSVASERPRIVAVEARNAADALPSGLVDHVVINRVARDRCFDAYVMVDWSSSSKPNSGKDSIWIASGEWGSAGFAAGPPKNLSTREAAAQEITKLVGDLFRRGQRVLVGLDFAFGYPAGFASALGLSTSRGAWLALHEHFAQAVTDSPQNQHNRDRFADECNRRISPSGPGPFWGCTAGSVTPSLTQHRVGVFTFPYGTSALEQWRVTECRAASRTTTQSVWKLNCGVSVGGQTILGLKYLHQLAQAVGGRRWPFETGWTVPSADAPAVWFAEMFPSLVRYPEWDQEYNTRRDRTQVQSCVRYAAEHDAAGTLKDAFAQPADVDAALLKRVVDEEGWILFV